MLQSPMYELNSARSAISASVASIQRTQSIGHIRTQAYRPQTNGKVERYQRTLATEWAYTRTWQSDQQRADDLPNWLHEYNHHRYHTAVGGTPSTRVTNLTERYI